MIAPKILDFLYAKGISLEREEADLIARPSDAVTSEAVFLIRRHKPELLAELTDGEIFEVSGRPREARGANLADEAEIVWEEDPSNFDYVREYALTTCGRKRIAKWTGEGRRVGYAVLRPDAPHDFHFPGRFTRRIFFLKDHDRDSQPNGLYNTGAPCEAVDPRTISPGVPGRLTTRAWAERLDKSA
jgi:hypothetical protein